MKPQVERESLTPGGVAVPPPLKIESSAFTGSLATLFHLAREGRVDLSGIPLSPVCHAYLEYVFGVAPDRVDEAGAALLALAYLVERKAWSLLPIADPPPEQEIPELPAPTAHEFALAVDSLDTGFRELAQLFFRAGGVEGADYEIPIEIGHLTTNHLARALERLLSKAMPTTVEPTAKKRPSLAEVMAKVLQRIQSAGKRLGFVDLMPEEYTRLDAVFVFLAVLELLRIGRIKAGVAGEEIWLAAKES